MAFHSALLISIACLEIMTLVSAIAAIVKRHQRSVTGLLMACQVFTFQAVVLIGVMQQAWLLMGIGLLGDLWLAILLVVRESRKRV